MGKFMREYKALLERHGVEVFLLRKYVDDILAATGCLQLGSRWTGRSIEVSEEDRKMDEENSRTKEAVTMECLRSMADTVIPWLKFTSEVSEGEEKPVPCLDSQLWVGPPAAGEKWFTTERDDLDSPGDQ